MCVNMDENNGNSAGLLAALATAAAPNYLGNVARVDGMLRTLALDVLHRAEAMPSDQAAKLNDADCRRLTAIFLGQDPDFSPLPMWNAAGHIDRFVARELGWVGKTAEQTMRDMFTEFIQDFQRLLAYANTPGVPEHHWDWQGEAQLEFFRNLLFGIPGPKY